MAMTDPLADMLTRIRNANTGFKDKVDIPFSKLKLELARILSEEGFVRNYKVVEEKGRPHVIRLALKYGDKKERILSGLNVCRPRVAACTRPRPNCRNPVAAWGLPWSPPPRES